MENEVLMGFYYCIHSHVFLFEIGSKKHLCFDGKAHGFPYKKKLNFNNQPNDWGV